jgi:hypothetical protein
MILGCRVRRIVMSATNAVKQHKLLTAESTSTSTNQINWTRCIFCQRKRTHDKLKQPWKACSVDLKSVYDGVAIDLMGLKLLARFNEDVSNLVSQHSNAHTGSLTEVSQLAKHADTDLSV